MDIFIIIMTHKITPDRKENVNEYKYTQVTFLSYTLDILSMNAKVS